MSIRILHFHFEEMVWECGSLSVCECGYLTDSPGWKSVPFSEKASKVQTQQVFRGLRTKHEVFNEWLEIVDQYSGLLLTKETDRFKALAGLAQRFQQVLGSQYLAGLWYDDLPRGLLWAQWSFSARRKIQSTDVRIPTWSWVSIYHIKEPSDSNVSGVHYIGISETDVDSRVQVIEVICSRPEENPFTKPSVSSIFIRGACVSTLISKSVEGLKVRFDVHGENPTNEVTCLLLGIRTSGWDLGFLHFIVLEKLPSGKFQRIGKGELNPDKAGDWFQDVTPIEIEII
jgi:hypothetical protein